MLKLTRNNTGQYFTKDRAFEIWNPVYEFGNDAQKGWHLSKFMYEGAFETEVFPTLREAREYLEWWLSRDL